MSYASVAAHNAPPLDEQPRPDPALLTTDTPTTNTVVDGTAKLNIVAPEHPRFDAEDIPADDDDDDPRSPPALTPALLGIVNIGLIAGVGYSFYSRPSLRTSTKAITSTLAAVFALALTEGCAAEHYSSKTTAGERRRHWVVNYLHGFVARTSPYKGLLNTAVVGGVGYLGYRNRNLAWDGRAVAGVAAGLAALCGAEVFVYSGV